MTEKISAGVLDEGIAKAGAVLDFVGTGVTVTSSANKQTVTIPAAAEELLTTKGDLFTRSASANARQAVGASDYYVLQTLASQSNGLFWGAAQPQGGGTGQTTYTKGDVLAARNSTTLDKIAVGTDGYFFVADSTQMAGVKWQSGGAAPTVNDIMMIRVFL